MSPDVRDVIQKFANKVLEVFATFDVKRYPVDVEKIVEILKGRVLDDLEDPVAEGRIEYVKNQEYDFLYI